MEGLNWIQIFFLILSGVAIILLLTCDYEHSSKDAIIGLITVCIVIGLITYNIVPDSFWRKEKVLTISDKDFNLLIEKISNTDLLTVIDADDRRKVIDMDYEIPGYLLTVSFTALYDDVFERFVVLNIEYPTLFTDKGDEVRLTIEQYRAIDEEIQNIK